MRPQALVQPQQVNYQGQQQQHTAAGPGITVPEVKYQQNVENNLDRIRNLIKENRHLIAAQVREINIVQIQCVSLDFPQFCYPKITEV